ncbi:hypothetical protein D8Y22_07810 [Salinadaptatus halalkaliphilus]|uniref:Uncharacterized protein n=1 Tax=Salinadaptatus halalkaliphilus TaxID=2419781 RepID=A0A4S3TNB5_9EURY|nr:hypothetical protein [Salinadaptatus halalkaliphilus]THE65120.1 hypothetical protein D8Y22_07810 [Salinadaptatus halalkaliphilus]
MPEHDPGGFSALIGLEFTEVSEGYSRATLAVRDELTNPNGVLQEQQENAHDFSRADESVTAEDNHDTVAQPQSQRLHY